MLKQGKTGGRRTGIRGVSGDDRQVYGTKVVSRTESCNDCESICCTQPFSFGLIMLVEPVLIRARGREAVEEVLVTDLAKRE